MKIFAEKEAEDFLKKYVPVTKSDIVKNKLWKPPFVLKLISKKALHKSDVGGVKIIKSKEDGEKALIELNSIAKKKKLSPYSIIIQEYLEGTELIVGIKKDDVFGHAIMLGTGGTLVELIKDVSFRVCPITEKDAQDMIDELKLKQLLYGFRGSKKVNINSLKKILVKISLLPEKLKISEMDINPLIINEKEAKVADARIVFD